MIVEWVWLSVWLVCVVALIFVCFGCSLVVWFVGLVCDFGGLLLSCLVVCLDGGCFVAFNSGFMLRGDSSLPAVGDFWSDSFCGLAYGCCGLCFSGVCLVFLLILRRFGLG